MSPIYNYDTYYFEKNIQGDVIGIWTANGVKIANYTYDAWGNVTSIINQYGEDVTDRPTHQGNLNPIRYRGYYYDTDIELYWLNTRFYDQETGRFVNADGYVSTGQGVVSYNIYAYCGNNPVNRVDPTGMFWKEIWSFFVSAFKNSSALVVLAGAVISAPVMIWITKEKHYARNDNNTTIIETLDQIPSDWVTSNPQKYPDREEGPSAIAHQNTAPSTDKPNTKFCSPDKHQEVIFSDNGTLVVDASDVGTYNFGTNRVSHWFYDIVPWIWWGNTEDDPTVVWDRAYGLLWGGN